MLFQFTGSSPGVSEHSPDFKTRLKRQQLLHMQTGQFVEAILGSVTSLVYHTT